MTVRVRIGSSTLDSELVGRSADQRRWGRLELVLALAIVVPLVVLAAVIGLAAWDLAAARGRVGADLGLYLDATRSWLAGTGFYPERQLAAPYVITDGDVLYPPNSIPLFVVFLVAPSFLFVLLPLIAILFVTLRLRPRPLVWPLIAACFVYPPTLVKIIHANPVLWVAGAVALGLLYAWPAVFALIKPSLAPFALIGIHRRSWWIALAALAGVSLLFLPLWSEWVIVIRNSSNPDGLLYSLSDVPLVLVPILAWVGSERFGGRLRWPAG